MLVLFILQSFVVGESEVLLIAPSLSPGPLCRKFAKSKVVILLYIHCAIGMRSAIPHTLTPDYILFMKVLWSGVGMTAGSGKLQGTVMFKGKSGALARVKVTPINRRSADQSRVRAIFSGIAQLWTTLTGAEVTAWNDLAAGNFSTTNIWGNTVFKSGKALFQELNGNLQKVGQALITAAPDRGGASPITDFVPKYDVSAGTLQLNVDFNGSADVPAGMAIAVYATPKLPVGVSYIGKSQYRLIGYMAAGLDTSDTADCADIKDNYLSKFGSAPAVGDNIAYRVQCVKISNGAGGTPFSAALEIVP